MVLRVRGLRGCAGIRWMLKNPNHSVQKPCNRQNFQTLYANVVFVGCFLDLKEMENCAG